MNLSILAFLCLMHNSQRFRKKDLCIHLIYIIYLAFNIGFQQKSSIHHQTIFGYIQSMWAVMI